ncbi:hypothetical protein [Nocardioides renjunii]|nr:hypothetical protein [Nocardioides sp. S-34]WQQ22227.1 hypothetical protein SHK17_20350 [Nocardioides sp. S-34]
MTTTPNEPSTEPTIVPSGDPDVNPIDPGEVPDSPIPETRPDGDR